MFDFMDIMRSRRNFNCVNFNGAQDWDEFKTAFDGCLVLLASTYNPHRLFPVEAVEMVETLKADMPEGTCDVSPSGGFRYTEVILSKGHWLNLIQGNRLGRVCFDDDVVIPRVNQSSSREDGFIHDPWMSVTPMEALTQRGGIRRAKGHVVIAGLGLGWMLQHVCNRKQVERVTLVEISQELVDWVLPRLKLNGTPVDVVVGDARKLVPEMEADVALTDIDAGYGGNSFQRCPKIGYVWTWGSQFCA